MALLLLLAGGLTTGIMLSKTKNEKQLDLETTILRTDTSTTSAISTDTSTTSAISTDTSTTSAISTDTSTTSAISTDTSTTSAISTTTTTCAPGYSRAPSGICVNLLIDINNCGSFGYVCSSNYTSCSAGNCSNTPAVQLDGGISIFNVSSTNVDDSMIKISLPLSIRLYNYSTMNVTVTTNGVSILFTL